MVGTKEAIEVVEQAAGDMIVNIELLPAGFVRGYFLNHINLRRLYRVIVDSTWQSMRVWMTSVVKTKDQNRAIAKAVKRIKRSLTRGLVGIVTSIGLACSFGEGFKKRCDRVFGTREHGRD